MNGIEKITDRIRSDIQEEIDALNTRTEAECEGIKARYDQLAQQEYWSLIEQGTKAGERKIQQILSGAQQSAKQNVLALKQEMVSRAFDLAVTRLSEMEETRYVPFLAALAANASRSGDEQIILSTGDRTRYGKKIAALANQLLQERGSPAGLTLSEQSRNIRGGLILSRGNIEVNCSLETLVGMRKAELSGEVAGILFA